MGLYYILDSTTNTPWDSEAYNSNANEESQRVLFLTFSGDRIGTSINKNTTANSCCVLIYVDTQQHDRYNVVYKHQ